MATAVFARYENSADDNTDDPNDEVFSLSATTKPSGHAATPGNLNTPGAKKKLALPSTPKDATNCSPSSRYQSCNGDVQVNGQHDTVECNERIVVDHFEVLQQTLKACRESLDRIDKFRAHPSRKRRLAYAARTFGLSTKPPPLYHSSSDVISVGNRCAVDSANTCSPVVPGNDTCSTRGKESAPLPWCALSATSSSPHRPTTSPSPPPTGASPSTSLPTASTTTTTTSVGSLSPATPTVYSFPHLPTDPVSLTMPQKSSSPITHTEIDSPTSLSSSNQTHSRPSTPFIHNKPLPFSSSSTCVETAKTKVSSSTYNPSTHHSSLSTLPSAITSSTPTSSPCEPSSTTSTHSMPSQPPGSTQCHVPPRSAPTTPPSSAHSHLHNDQGPFDAQNTRSSPRPGGLEPRERSHSDGGGGWRSQGGEGKGVMQAEVGEITVEFEEAVGMVDGKDLADLVESAVDEVETAVDDDDDQVEETGRDGSAQEGEWPGGSAQEGKWPDDSAQVNGLLGTVEEEGMVPIGGSGLEKKSREDSGSTQGRPCTMSLHDHSDFEKSDNFVSSCPKDCEVILDRLADTREDEKVFTTRPLTQRLHTCLYRGKRTKMEREAKFGGKLRVRFADDVERERETDGGKDSCERRKRICATSELEEHLDWLQAEALDRRMTLVEENMLYIQDSLDRLLRSDDSKVGRCDPLDSGYDPREDETLTREDSSSPYNHHHYHHYHHLSRSIIIMFIMCMVFILCVLLLLPVVARTVTVAYIPGQSVF